jgi:hypothetical protein
MGLVVLQFALTVKHGIHLTDFRAIANWEVRLCFVGLKTVVPTSSEMLLGS